MKKLVSTATLLATFSSFAGTTATLNLKGVIAPILDISITQETLATALPLDQAVNKQKVGRLTEKSNHGAGYKIAASSQNAGKLVRSGDNSSFINYQLFYNNAAIALNTTPAVISTHSVRGTNNRDLSITYSKPADYMAAGEYSDVVTFTISAN